MSYFDFSGPPPGYAPAWLDRHQVVAVLLIHGGIPLIVGGLILLVVRLAA